MTPTDDRRPNGRRAITSLRVLAAAVAVLGLLFAAFGTASAQAGEARLTLREYASQGQGDADSSTLGVVYTGDEAALANATITENGTQVPLVGSPKKIGGDIGVAFVVDTGPGMDGNNLLTSTRESITRFARANPTVAIAIVQAGDDADLKTEFTTDIERIESAVNDLGPSLNGGSAIWGGLALAGKSFEGQTRLQRNVVLITADSDNVQTRTPVTLPGGKVQNAPVVPAVGRANILAHQVALFGIEYTGPGGVADPTEIDALIAKSTGPAAVYTSTEANGERWSTLINQVGKAITTQQYELTYRSSVPDGDPVHLELTVDGQTTTADVLAGRSSVGGEALRPEIGTSEKTLGFAGNPLAFAVALLLVLGAVVAAAYALSTLFMRDGLDHMLSAYADSYGDVDGESEVSSSALIKRAVALTEQVAENQGLLVRAEAALERANLPLRAGEALFVYVLIVVVGTVLPLVYTRNLIAGVIFGVLSAYIPTKVVSYIANKRRKNFMSQLPDTLSLLSGTLRAGYSLMQGVEAVSVEVEEPMGFELRRIVTESRLGRPLEEAMESSAERMDSPDFAWAVMAIRIQREVGGNLSELLLTVADTMIARERLRRDVAALTAEGRVSAAVLAFMPPALAGVMYVMNKDYVSKLFTDGLGIGMTVVATTSMLIGFMWMKKIINIEI